MKYTGTRWFDIVTFRRKRSADWLLPAAAGLGVGMLAGVGLGIFFAPQTGEEARMKLRQGAVRVKEKAADLAGRARSQVAAVESNELRS